ncbi:molybdate ABC transporter substrate-binding protein [Corynebacterium sp. UMB9976]|uniref:molybdate ABC transporter substrate-binding protein n=1 Tax=Corynebacterium sp. UMB9976 TaxID=3046354 RepID=UPI00254FEE86|nr:molybdate ABC transporter substrate-binding protein [Corynebacterium sp. UMB9976]MDK6301732.1 molybdate ABC transporter substrate-binding protein [Corynebacterium sp. UMB9976]
MMIRSARRATGRGLARGATRRAPHRTTRRTSRFVAALAAALAGMLALAACSSEDTSNAPLRVFAAASLSVAGDDLLELYAAEHDGQQIEWNFAGSSALVRQIEQGSPADAFISADEKNMDKALQLPEFSNVTDRGEPRIVATNQLVLAVAENPTTPITSLEDLSKGARVAICAPEVPCGTLAHEALNKADTTITLQNPSEEANVSDVATKVATGQVDAGFIYASDAAAIQRQGTKITTLPIAHVAPNKYPAASTDAGADNRATTTPAAEFVRWLATPTAQRILAEHGFGPGEIEMGEIEK